MTLTPHEVADVLELQKIIAAQGMTEAELEAVLRHAREDRSTGLSYPEHLAALAEAMRRGGKPVRDAIVALSQESPERRDARLAIAAWTSETLAGFSARRRAMTDEDLEELRRLAYDELRRGWPDAHDAKIAGAITVSTFLRCGALVVETAALLSAMHASDIFPRAH